MTAPATAQPSVAAIGPLYRLFLRHQLTAGRIALIGVLSAFALLIGFATGTAVADDERIRVAVEIGSSWGLTLMTPIVALVMATSALGDLVDDETLVYLWQRPVSRFAIAVSAWLAALTVAVPAAAIPLGLSALLTSADATTAVAVALANALAVIGYGGLFVLLGVLVRRSLPVGLAYVFIWELVVSRISTAAVRLSINTYPASLLSRMTDIELQLAERHLVAAVLVPIVVALVAVWLTAQRLNRMDIA